MRKGIWIIGLCCLLLSVLPAWAAGEKVRADVDLTTLTPGESLELRVTVQGGDGEVDTSGLSDFKVIPQGTGTSVRIINNRTTREATHTFLLIPKRQGKLTIPPLAVTIDGRRHHTEPIAVNVSAQVATERDDAPDVWVDVSISDPQPYVGQQTTFRFSLFQAVRVTNGTLEPPDFEGFSTNEIKERGSRREIIDGRKVVVTEINYVLVPLKSGTRTIEPATLQLGIIHADRQRRRSRFDDFFDDPFFNRGRVETKVLQSSPLEVQVRPLPAWKGSEPFSGLVGRFEMASKIETTQLKVGGSTTLTVTVQGRGNIMDAQPPQLTLPEGLKTYADAPEEKIQLDAEGYQGKKVFRTALVPIRAGEIQLPPVQLTYFDVEEERYRTLTASLPALSVQPGTDQSVPILATPQTPGTQKKRVAFTGRDILPPKEGLDALVARHPMRWPMFVLWLILPAAAFGLLTLFQRLKQTDTSPSATMRRRARQAFKSAQADRTADPSAYLTELYRALTSAIYARVGRSGEALAWKEAETLLQDNGVEPETARQASALLTAIESSRYSGAQLTGADRRELLDQTRRMIRRLAP